MPVEWVLVRAIVEIVLCLVRRVLISTIQRVRQLDGQTFLVLLWLVFTHTIKNGRRVCCYTAASTTASNRSLIKNHKQRFQTQKSLPVLMKSCKFYEITRLRSPVLECFSERAFLETIIYTFVGFFEELPLVSPLDSLPKLLRGSANLEVWRGRALGPCCVVCLRVDSQLR